MLRTLTALLAFICPISVLGQEVPQRTAEGFAVPQPGYTFSFPRDHGSHPEFSVEWWYITGHLRSTDGRRFGMQATFFRVANQPPEERADGLFSTGEIHMAHMALLDLENKRYLHQERLNRKGWDASASEETLQVRNGNWSLAMLDPGREAMRLKGSVHAQAQFDLRMVPAKEKVIFGENSVSRKGEAPTASSYYITFTRLAAEGELLIDGAALQVDGLLWMDHEISSNQLADDQAGWDWLSIQLDDGRDIMLYRLRKTDGSTDPHSQLVWVDEGSQPTHLPPESWKITPRRFWESGKSAGRYPVEISVTTKDPATGEPFTFVAKPLMEAQEFVGNLGGVTYWEGAVDILTPEGRRIGQGYMELTGYGDSLGDRL